MYVISGVLNTSLAGVSEIINERKKNLLLEVVREQIAGGAHCIALNCGTHITTEVEDMEWLVKTIHGELEIPICIDSPNALVQEVGLKNNKCGRALVDSITLEQSRINAITPLVKKYNAKVIVLLHDESGMPKNSEERLALLPKLETVVQEFDLQKADIFIDSLVFPLAVNTENSNIYLASVQEARKRYPGYQYCCGLDNISFGLPQQELLNIAMLGMLVGIKQEAVIIKLTPAVVAFMHTMQGLSGLDVDMKKYLQAFRSKKLEVLR
ncbi:MAG: dihydropteroate synthase [Clostridia bacterium]